jgi:hypothetical protein
MSNTLAVAAVTATLRRELDNAFQAAAAAHPAAVANARAFAGPPSRPHPNTTAGVDIYLYRVGPNPALANIDLPTRDGEAAPVDVPTAALTLWYLLTFFGDADDLEPEQLLGAATARLHAGPVLSPGQIAAAVGATPALAGADLDRQPEYVRLRRVPLSDDEMNRIWSMLPAGTFGLSVVYEASVVLVQVDQQPREPYPVLERGIVVAAGRGPRLHAVASAAGPTASILPGTRLVLQGSDLTGPALRVELDGTALAGGAIVATRPDQLDVTLPAATRPGAHTIAVVHQRPTGVGAATVDFRSTDLTFAVRPVVQAVAVVGGNLRVTMTTAAAAGQQLAIVLHHTATTDTVTLAAAPGANPDRVEAPVAGVAAGTYIVQVRVDGVASIPSGPAGAPFNSPSVVVP